MDAHGNSLVVWDQKGTFRARSFSASGRLGATQVVWPRSMGAAYESRLIVSPSGQALMLWRRDRDGAPYLRTRSPSGQLGPLEQPLGVRVNPSSLIDAVITPGGRATLLISTQTHSSAGYGGLLYVEQIEANGALDPPVTVADVNPPGDLETLNPISGTIGADSRGDVVISWLQATTVQGTPQLWTRTLSASGVLGSAIQVQTLACCLLNPPYAVTVTPSGKTTFVWEFTQLRGDGGGEQVQARAMTAGGALGQVRNISPVYTSRYTTHNSDGFYGLQLGGLFASPLGNDAAVVGWITYGPQSSAFYERRISQSGLASSKTIVADATGNELPNKRHPVTAQPTQGELVAGGDSALAVWTIAGPSTHPAAFYDWGLLGRSVSGTGNLGPVKTVFDPGQLNPFVPSNVDVAMNASGRAVAIANSYHGLAITTGRVL
jgi:hypothetical protein